MMMGFLDCLKRERDISIKAISSGGKMAFRCNSPLRDADLLQIMISKILEIIIHRRQLADPDGSKKDEQKKLDI